MDARAVRQDLDFLVNNPKKSLASTYHDAGHCWLLIDACVREIRRLRKRLGKVEGRGLGKKTSDDALNALRRAAKTAVELARATGTPAYVMENGKIVDATKRKGRSRN